MDSVRQLLNHNIQNSHQSTEGTLHPFQAKPNIQEMYESFVTIIEYIRGYIVSRQFLVSVSTILLSCFQAN